MQHRRCIAATLSAVLEPKEWNRNGPRHELAHFVVYYRDLVRMLAEPLPPLPVSTLRRENAEREIDDKGLGTALSSGLDEKRNARSFHACADRSSGRLFSRAPRLRGVVGPFTPVEVTYLAGRGVYQGRFHALLALVPFELTKQYLSVVLILFTTGSGSGSF